MPPYPAASSPTVPFSPPRLSDLFLQFVCTVLGASSTEATLVGTRVVSGAEHVAQVLAWPGPMLDAATKPPIGRLFAFAANVAPCAGFFSLLIRSIGKRPFALK